MGLKTLLGAFGLLAFVVIVRKHGGSFSRRSFLCSNKGEKDKDKDARMDFFFGQGY